MLQEARLYLNIIVLQRLFMYIALASAGPCVKIQCKKKICICASKHAIVIFLNMQSFHDIWCNPGGGGTTLKEGRAGSILLFCDHTH